MRGSAWAAATMAAEVKGLVRSMSAPCHERTASASMARWSCTHGRIHVSHQAPKGAATVAGSAPPSSRCSNPSICMLAMATPRPAVGAVVATESPTATRPGRPSWGR